jgi:acyl-CoA reductase-like NAD-dependent aldehyde dehydrogenase
MATYENIFVLWTSLFNLECTEGAFYNTGQSCCAVDRIYVHRKVYDQFEAAFVQAVAAFEFGLNPMDPKVCLPSNPLIF